MIQELTCPNKRCNATFMADSSNMQYHKYGRKIDCPVCKEKMIVMRIIRKPKEKEGVV